MADVKKVEKTAESGGIRNVGSADPTDPTFVTPDTAIEQASATVPGSIAAAEHAFPSDDVVAKLETVAPTAKTFREVSYERERDAKLGIAPETTGEAYGDPNKGREVKPSKRSEAEQKRGQQAANDAGGFRDQPGSPTDIAGRVAEEAERNKAADEQRMRIHDQLRDEKEAEAKKGRDKEPKK